MFKRVNVFPTVPVYSIKNPIIGTTFNVELSVGDILCCIYARAKVEEILPNGNTINLNLKNYNKVNFIEEKVEHVSNTEGSKVEESNNKLNTTSVLEEQIATLEDPSEVVYPEAINPEEQVEENLVVDKQQKKKNKKR